MDTLPNDGHEFYARKFSGLNFAAALLAGKEVAGKEVAGKEFESCEFSQCDFSQARLTGCKFIDCRFTGCNLSLVDVANAHFRGVEFAGCKLVGVNWTKASWPRLILAPPLQFRECVIDESSFFGLQLEEVAIEACKAREVDFREANFSGAKFACSDLTNSLFGRTSLRGADFTEAVGYRIDIFDNDIKNARFSRNEAIRLLDSLPIELVD